jgi:hypothetical protein
MALAQGILKERTSPQDLGISFEVNGERFGFFISAEAMKSKKKTDLMALLTDGEGSPIACGICCAQKAGSALCYVRCMDDGKCCDSGKDNCD